MLIQNTFDVLTTGRGAYEITREVQEEVARANIDAGLCSVFVHHTSASLMICENADPDVLTDMETFLAKLVPDGCADFVHTAEGPDDMPAHVRSILTQPGITIPVQGSRCSLGTWQGIFLYEHRLRGHRRRVTISIQGAAPTSG